MTARLDTLRLARTDGVGPVTFRRLLRRYEGAAAAIDALPALARAGGRATPPNNPSPAAAAREVEQVEALGGRLLLLGEPDYPELLSLLEDAPPVLAVLGSLAAIQSEAVAIVGSRNASANGRRMAEILAEAIAQAGLVVVSGLARGIDTSAHLGALRAGQTVACVAGGPDVPYPLENRDLQARIAEGGAVVSEMPPGTVPQARHFPRRNRIIAGLSLGVVVVEAALRSGSLITARQAVEANREVFAVPGSPLDPRCRGSNSLLRDGAHLTESVDDVLAPLRGGLSRAALVARAATPLGLAELLEPNPTAPAASPDELAAARAELVELLGPAPTAVDDLIRRCQFSAAAIRSVLLDLEIAGFIETLPGNRVAWLAEPRA